MIKTKAKIEIQKDDRFYEFYCDNDAPLGEVYDSIMKMREHVLSRINASIEEAKKDEQRPNS